MALKSLEKNDEKEAIRLFKDGLSSPNTKTARLSAENLTKIGNVNDRNNAARYLVSKYDDYDARLLATKVFFEQKEYTKVIEMTDKIQIADCPDQLSSYRIESLLRKKDSRFQNEVFDWFTSRPFSTFHADFYSTWKKYLENNPETQPEEQNSIQNIHNQIMDYRILVWKKNYKPAFTLINSILDLYKQLEQLPDYHLISDMGKASLYGTDDFKISAQKFERLGQDYSSQKQNELAYCAYFYSARLYDRAGRYQEKTVQRFKSALDSTENSQRFDDALWYLLNMQLRMSTDDIMVTLKKYADRISNPGYFDDFFDNLSVILLSHKKWQDFYDVWKLIDGIATEETACKYAYISGRILEEGYGETDGKPKTKEAVNAYTRVLSGNASTYYKVCTLERMNIVDKTYVTDVLCSGGPELKRNSSKDSQQLIAGYAEWGFPQKVYGQWMADKENISMEKSLDAIRFLSQCGVFDSDYNVQSLRLAARVKTWWSGKIPYELLEFNYPRLYSQYVTEACAQNNLSEPLLYALIRSESFFDPKISSSAGACGLTQLMRPTANDEARKLKLGEDFDILDPETNIKMGSHYFASLIQRTTGKSELLALFAYNAGLSNVRKWERPQGMSMDLFLETLPFAETREYGRKLVGAAAMYGFLYYGITPAETVRNLLK